MKLATLKSSSRDGQLIVVSKDNNKMALANSIASSLREAVENWSSTKHKLEQLYQDINSGKVQSQDIQWEHLQSPLPRTFQWIDGSAFIQHIRLVRKSRKAPIPETLKTIPLVYQGAGDSFLGPYEDIPQVDFSHGTDFEGEVGVIVDDVPMGVTPQRALKHIILFVLINDISLRGLAPEELKRGFGFVQSKPSSSLAPFAVTDDELGSSWKEGRIHLPLLIDFNGKSFGRACAGEMHFHFGEIISHCAKTRRLMAGTLIGSGTVSNQDSSKGSSCLVEKRTLEQIATGQPKQSYMKSGDQVTMKILDDKNQNIFGTISQKVVCIG